MICSVDVIVEDLRWSDKLDLEAIGHRAAAAVAAQIGWDVPSELSLLAADDTRLAGLNRDFRDKHQATNVLSWPAMALSPAAPGETPPLPEADPTEDLTHLGDIALAFETCEREAIEGEKSLNDHATHLIVHGILHLFGYDHVSDPDASLMEGLETAILSKLGIESPYE